MTLRSRLSLFFVAIVVIPLTGAAITVGMLVPQELDERVDERLRGAASAVAAVRTERLDRAAREVSRIAHGLAAVPASARPARLAAARTETGLDFLRYGATTVGRTPRFAGGFTASLEEASGGVLFAAAPLPDGLTLAGGWYTDAAWAQRLAEITGIDVAILHEGRVIASAGTRTLAGRAIGDAHARTITVGESEQQSIVLRAPRPHPGRNLVAAIGGIGGAGLLLAGAMGFLLARAMARPLSELSEQAAAIASGDYSKRVPAKGPDEVATLARSINAMSDAVQEYVEELHHSHEELRGTLQRLGATLRSTRGMAEMLEGVLEAASATLGAGAGAIFRLQGDGTLAVESSIGFEAAQATREAASQAIRDGAPVLLPGFGGDDPLGRTVVAAPLRRGDEIAGVLTLVSTAVPQTFDEHDLAMLASFAEQASVAIENVYLREQAEQLARTDPLTAMPNRRAMEEMLGSELDRVHRYGRPLSVLMIDLDHFKSVNDRFGHQNGDRVLIEAARRICSVLRGGIDVVARYGGEEFVVVLPETPAWGALATADKIVEALAAEPFEGAGGTYVTGSVGVASVPGDGPGADDVLNAADIALYRAKEQGRNRVVATSTVAREVARA